MENNRNIDSFILYEDFYKLLKHGVKNDKHRWAIMCALCEYVFYGEEPQGLDMADLCIFETQAKLIMKAIGRRAQLVENGMKGAEYGKLGAEYGKLGGRPRKENPQTETQKTPQETPQKLPFIDEFEDGNETKSVQKVNKNHTENAQKMHKKCTKSVQKHNNDFSNKSLNNNTLQENKTPQENPLTITNTNTITMAITDDEEKNKKEVVAFAPSSSPKKPTFAEVRKYFIENDLRGSFTEYYRDYVDIFWRGGLDGEPFDWKNYARQYSDSQPNKKKRTEETKNVKLGSLIKTNIKKAAELAETADEPADEQKHP